MSEFTDDDLLEHVLGLCPADRSAAIARAVENDPELASQLSLVRMIAASAEPQAQTPRKSFWYRFLRLVGSRRGLITAAVVLLLAFAGGMTWYIVVGPALMHDNFNDRYFDSRKWRSSRPRVTITDGYLRLMNRGSVMTSKEFKGPIEITFDWKWIDHAENPLYADDLCIVLRTTGKHREKHAFEIQDGVVVRFMTYQGLVKIEPNPPGGGFQTEEGAVKIRPDEWQHIRITDDGEFISVYATGPLIDKKYKKEPVIRARCPDTAKAYHIAIYNREKVAEATHESRIDNFEIRKLK